MGNLVAQGQEYARLNVSTLTVSPGEHEITVEVTPNQNDAWFSLCLKTHHTNIFTDASWTCSRQKPPSWPHGFRDDATIHWFAPKRPGFVLMQSRQQLMRPWSGWDNPPGQATAYLRKKIVIPTE